jgi:hypothetical protein
VCGGKKKGSALFDVAGDLALNLGVVGDVDGEDLHELLLRVLALGPDLLCRRLQPLDQPKALIN